jgi:hypothetical protein
MEDSKSLREQVRRNERELATWQTAFANFTAALSAVSLLNRDKP